MAVRQHLSVLQGEGVVDFEEERRGQGKVGRPARLWRLTAKAISRFPDGHADLAVGMLQAVENVFGANALEQLAADRTAAQIESYRARMPRASESLERRLVFLTKIRCEEGFLADWRRQQDGTFELVENHCAISRAVRVCPALCDGELTLFQAVLGEDVSVDPVEHLLCGDRRCAYRIKNV